MPKLLKWADDLDHAGNWKEQLDMIRDVVYDSDNNWNQYIMSLFQDIDNEVLQATFRNFLINASMIGYPAQRKKEEELGCNVP